MLNGELGSCPDFFCLYESGVLIWYDGFISVLTRESW